jgi:hypothetical protein
MNNKMITEILDERVFSDGNTVPKWKKYNEGIMKAVQVIKQYQANEVSTSAEALPIAIVVGRSEQLVCPVCALDGFDDQCDLDIHLEDCEDIAY